MRVSDILEEWKKDAVIDKVALDDEALRIPVLHAKYLDLYIHQRVAFKNAQANLALLRSKKRAWYLGEMTKDELEAEGWQQYQKIVIKTQIESILSGDPNIIAAQFNVDALQEKVALLDQIMKMLVNRSYQISNAISFMKMQNGIG